MATNAELRAAAERLMDYDIPTNDDELDMIARHILATVPADDRPSCPYTLVPMTINADGSGPEMDPAKVVYTEWQVWDELNRCVAVVPPEDDGEPVTVGKLRQQLADVTAELEAARAAASAEATFADEMLAERTRLLAELLKQPPTLEWLRETFGEPVWHGSLICSWDRINYYTIGKATSIDVEHGTRPLATRAAVLAAVAETKGASDGK